MEEKNSNQDGRTWFSERKKMAVLVAAVVAICVAVFALSAYISSSGGGSKDDELVPNNTEEIRMMNPFDEKIGGEEKNPGVLPPEKGAEDVPEKSPFDIPKAAYGARISFVFDDAGQSTEHLSKYIELPFPFAVAVLPGLQNSKECADAVRASGRELILHQPMQAENLQLDPGPKAVTALMNTREISEIVDSNVDELGGGVVGINNHEGSLITANVIKIGAVLEVCKNRGIYFLDSRTTPRTMAHEAALELDVRFVERTAPYLDNEIDRGKILSRIYEGLAYANRHGSALMIGHIDKSVGILPELLSEMYPYLVASGYTFVLPSALLQ